MLNNNNKLTVNDIIKKFNLKLIGKYTNLDRIISATGFNRPGFELCDHYFYDSLLAIVYFGTKENFYLNTLDDNTIKLKFESILKLNPPCIISGKSFEYDNLLIDLCQKYDVPLIKINMSLYEINYTLGNYISSKLAKSSMIHGTLVSIYGIGVLIIGESGIGKSEIAIELIKKGHIFICDDAVKYTCFGSIILGEAEPKIKDLIEVRGLGILSFSKTFGIEKMIDSIKISLVIELVDCNNKKNMLQFDRFGNKQEFLKLNEINYLPKYKLPVITGRNMAELIETAVTNYKLKLTGYNPLDNLIKK